MTYNLFSCVTTSKTSAIPSLGLSSVRYVSETEDSEERVPTGDSSDTVFGRGRAFGFGVCLRDAVRCSSDDVIWLVPSAEGGLNRA